MVPRQRFEPCHLLRDKGIPCFAWFEDAISRYGVPTVLFDLYLLVPDLDEANNVLSKHGWMPRVDDNRIYYFLDQQPIIPHRRLQPPGYPEIEKPPLPPSKDPPGPTTTVLLLADDWNVPAEILRSSPPGGIIPPLALLLDALIDCFLDASPGPLRTHMGTQVVYLYGYCKSLKAERFAECLKPEHGQFHIDALSKPGLGTMPFITHQRQVRDAFRHGK